MSIKIVPFGVSRSVFYQAGDHVILPDDVPGDIIRIEEQAKPGRAVTWFAVVQTRDGTVRRSLNSIRPARR
jgi:hypothetical protein